MIGTWRIEVLAIEVLVIARRVIGIRASAESFAQCGVLFVVCCSSSRKTIVTKLKRWGVALMAALTWATAAAQVQAPEVAAKH